MAIYHLSAQIISRTAGRSAVASAAYRAGERLHDARIDRTHDFRAKGGVVHSEIMLPEGASEEWHDRERLWNDVEAAELRRDAQLAREIELAIPIEMNQTQGIELVRDYVADEFVSRGMIADVNVHWDNPGNPHAHVMLTMREAGIDENGDPSFGAKVRAWNEHALLERWRERWGAHVNERLAALDIDARIDHRSLEAQGIGLEPQSEIGAAASQMERDGLIAERAEEHRAIARENGVRIIADPSLALDAITQQQSTFTARDLARFAHRHSDGIEQFNEVMAAVRQSDQLVELGKDRLGSERFTSLQMIAAEQRLELAADRLAMTASHGIEEAHRAGAMSSSATRGMVLTREQRDALLHVTDARGLSLVVGTAGAGKSAMLGVARAAWEAAGYEVTGAALSGIAAENLTQGSGIAARTIASLEHGWSRGQDLLTSRHVLVIDEAGMVGTRQLERVMAHAAHAGAKLVLVGDPQQLQSIEAGAAFRALHERHGGAEIASVRRQHAAWQREATSELARGNAGAAIAAYDERGMVHGAQTREAARGELIEGWDRNRQAAPERSSIILTHTNDEVRALNAAARQQMQASGDLGEDVSVMTERGGRNFASGDRVMFLKNERSLAVRNGSLGTVEQVTRETMAVRLDDGRSVSFDLKDYAHIDHGYAATIHKAQGMTVDRVHVLATPGMDAHSSYVALSRHREQVDLHYGRDDFAGPRELARTLSRDRAKDMASDYQPGEALRRYAERRGLGWRERVTELTRSVADKLRGLVEGLRWPSEGPRVGAEPALEDHAAQMPGRGSAAARPVQLQFDLEPQADKPEDPERALRIQRGEALRAHARAIADIFASQDQGGTWSEEQRLALEAARNRFEEVRPFGWRDAEAAYRKEPKLALQALTDNVQPVVEALQHQSHLRERADWFVETWDKLRQTSEIQYRHGGRAAMQETEGMMRDMARSLERDPQLESILANRKMQLGIGDEIGGGRSLGRALTYSMGIDYELGRGLGI